MERRTFLKRLCGVIAAPLVVKASVLMPVSPSVPVPPTNQISLETTDNSSVWLVAWGENSITAFRENTAN